jgi:hypothetical protein
VQNQQQQQQQQQQPLLFKKSKNAAAEFGLERLLLLRDLLFDRGKAIKNASAVCCLGTLDDDEGNKGPSSSLF